MITPLRRVDGESETIEMNDDVSDWAAVVAMLILLAAAISIFWVAFHAIF